MVSPFVCNLPLFTPPKKKKTRKVGRDIFITHHKYHSAVFKLILYALRLMLIGISATDPIQSKVVKTIINHPLIGAINYKPFPNGWFMASF